MASVAYSFLDVYASISGPGGSILMGGDGAGVADEGITCAYVGDKNTMTTGADGTPMHSLHADWSGTIAVRLLKTSPVNAMLSAMFDYQATTAANWGQNTIHVANPTRGDDTTGEVCAFRKKPDFANAKDGGTVEWMFDVGRLYIGFGDGTPST